MDQEYRQVLKRAGFSLVLVGIADIALMIICIYKHMSYSSSFNIFAVVAGIFLMRGGLKTARVVAFFSGSFAAALLVVLAALPFIYPLELYWVYLKTRTVSTLLSTIFIPSAIAYLMWLYFQTTAESVLLETVRTRTVSSIFTSNKFTGVVLGCALGIFLVCVMLSLRYGGTLAKAAEKAGESIGGGYKYSLMSYSKSNNLVEVKVTAYNDKEIKDVRVQWQE